MDKTARRIETDLEESNTASHPANPGGLAAFFDKHENKILALTAVVIFLILWEILPAYGIFKPIFTSSPSRVVNAAQWLFAHGFTYDIWVSAQEFAVGFSMAVLIGIPLGILLGWNRRLNAMFDPFIAALYATPRVAFLPLLILWLGIGTKSIIAVVFLGAFFPILLNTLTGVKTVDEDLLLCARSFRANDFQILTTLALPTSVPFIITGMRLGVGRGLVGVVVGELIASQAGIGHMMSLASSTFQTDKYFVGVVILAVCGYIFTEALKLLESRFESWRPGSR